MSLINCQQMVNHEKRKAIMGDDLTRRRFMKYGLATLGAFVASAVAITVDKTSGFMVGRNRVNVGMSQANATCGASFNCAGGGGECGASFNCSGGGGKCGASFNCAGQ